MWNISTALLIINILLCYSKNYRRSKLDHAKSTAVTSKRERLNITPSLGGAWPALTIHPSIDVALEVTITCKDKKRK